MPNDKLDSVRVDRRDGKIQVEIDLDAPSFEADAEKALAWAREVFGDDFVNEGLAKDRENGY